jgi:fused signal recognition particle receptor
VTYLLLAIALVVVAVVVVRVRRRRVPTPRVSAPLPTVLVEAPVARPDLRTVESLDVRLGQSRSLFDRVRGFREGTLTDEQHDVLEEVLLRSDVGVATTAAIVADVAASSEPPLQALRRAVRSRLGDASRALRTDADEGRVPVWLFVGVNGVGKTTTIGKVATREAQAGRQVVLAAGDTFRAAAADQLTQWAERAGVDIVRGAEGSDPGAVIHDAIGRAAARGADLVVADTAGRRHTSSNLLDELAKIRRVADRAPGQVVETILVLDATTGQNALRQAGEFLGAAGVTGIALTKLDGTARGGIVVAVQQEWGIPVKLVGVGEGAGDLRTFDPDAFVDALLGA